MQHALRSALRAHSYRNQYPQHNTQHYNTRATSMQTSKDCAACGNSFYPNRYRLQDVLFRTHCYNCKKGTA